MAKRRRSNSNKDGGIILGILTCIFLPIFLMLGSKNPIVKAIGGILLFVIFIGLCCASNGIAFEESAPFLLILLIVCFVLLFMFVFGPSDNKNTKDKTTDIPSNRAAVKNATIKKVDMPAAASVLPNVQSIRPFDKLFSEMEKEVGSVVGASVPDKRDLSTGNENRVLTESASAAIDCKKKLTEKAATTKSVPKTVAKTSNNSIKNQTNRSNTNKVSNSVSGHSDIGKSVVRKETTPIPVVTINKTDNSPHTSVLPKIILPDSVSCDNMSSEQTSYTIDTSFMNSPVENEDSEASCVPGTVDRKEGVYFDSIAEAVKVHKVSNDYKKIMIYRIENTEINECPGLVWKDSGYLKVLPLLRSARIFQWPLKSIPIVIGERRYEPDYDNEYGKICESRISTEFTELYPEYPFGNRGVYTDIFTLPVGLSVTNTSAKSLFSLIEAELYIDDEVMKSDQYVPAIKQIYRKHFLYENHVISAEEYNNTKEEILEEYLETERNDNVYRAQIKHLQKLQL